MQPNPPNPPDGGDQKGPEMVRRLVEQMAHNNINVLAQAINHWANDTFPNRTPQGMFLKLYGEIGEMIDAGQGGAGEFADVMILMLDYAIMMGWTPSVAIIEKMEINKDRTWVRTVAGNWQHVK